MEQFILKSALVAEIEKWVSGWTERLNNTNPSNPSFFEGGIEVGKHILSFIDTLEVKEMEEMYERPTIKIKDDISVISRLQYIDEDLKPIADFIMDYASWNLHKDEWNHPVLEVPLFRVLDALIQRGKPYCEG